tara:strand:+ start:131 stop:754 length:624 start_codon:yes stop_codon:yes gene_type:complete
MNSKYILNDKKNNFVKYNFKQLGDIDILELINNLSKIKKSDWDTDSIRTRGKTHEKVKTLPIRWKPEVLKQTNLRQIDNTEFYDILNFSKIESQLLSIYKKNYGDGFIHKIILADMHPEWTIKKHADSGLSLMSIHRTHIPLITNPYVTFNVNGETQQMIEGEVWEINNAQPHSVNNEGLQWRLHLIVDYYPNKGLSEEFKEKVRLF